MVINNESDMKINLRKKRNDGRLRVNAYDDTCKEIKLWKLFVIKTEEGVVRVRRLDNNATIPKRSTERVANRTQLQWKLLLNLKREKILIKTD